METPGSVSSATDKCSLSSASKPQMETTSEYDAHFVFATDVFNLFENIPMNI